LSPTPSTADGVSDAALADLLARAWTSLAAAIDDRTSPLRTPVLVTAGTDGRVVVLRAVDRDACRLTFFTDARAAKVGQIAADPTVVVVAYDANTLLQLRLHGSATVVDAAAAAALWAKVPARARDSYRTAAAPGTPIADPIAVLDGDGRDNFVALSVTVAAVDLLDLGGAAHRRARYRASDRWRGTWLVP